MTILMDSTYANARCCTHVQRSYMNETVFNAGIFLTKELLQKMFISWRGKIYVNSNDPQMNTNSGIFKNTCSGKYFFETFRHIVYKSLYIFSVTGDRRMCLPCGYWFHEAPVDVSRQWVYHPERFLQSDLSKTLFRKK